MERVACDSASEDFAIDFRAARLRVLVGFHHENSASFAERDSVAMVERGASVFGESVQREESRIRNGRERIRAARDYRVRLSRANKVRGVSDANRSGSACVSYVRDDAARSGVGCDFVRDRTYRHFEDVLFGLSVPVVVLDARAAAYAASDDDGNAASFFLYFVRKEFRVVQGLFDGLHAEFRGAIRVFGRIQIRAFDFGGEFRIASFRVHCGRNLDSAFSLEAVFPRFFHAVSDGANKPQTGNHATVFVFCHKSPL